MSDEKLSRKIAVFFGFDSPAWENTRRPDRMSAGALESGATCELVPRDMVNDPAMTVRLLSTDTNYGRLDILDDCAAVGIFDWSAMEWIIRVDLTKTRDNLGRAVAEAFAKAKGLI